MEFCETGACVVVCDSAVLLFRNPCERGGLGVPDGGCWEVAAFRTVEGVPHPPLVEGFWACGLPRPPEIVLLALVEVDRSIDRSLETNRSMELSLEPDRSIDRSLELDRSRELDRRKLLSREFTLWKLPRRSEDR